MPRYAAFLRAVSPMNAKMPERSGHAWPAGTHLPHDHPSCQWTALQGTRILAMQGGMIFSVYVPNPKGPVFMALIERTYGKEVTTRTWETVAKVIARGV